MACDQTRVPVTFSAGIATFEGIDAFDAALKLADQRLYKAKESGRNNVICSG